MIPMVGDQAGYLAVPYVFPGSNAEHRISTWLDGNVYRRPPPDLARIVRYLLRGHGVVASPSIARDPYDGSLISYPYQTAFATDGVWIWNVTIAYWVEHYHLKPPPQFLRHMRRACFRMPPASEVDTQAASEAFNRLMDAGEFEVSE